MTSHDEDQPMCDTPGCGRPIPKGGEGHPEICPTCLACLKLNGERLKGTEDKLVETVMNATMLIRAVADNPLPVSRAALRGFTDAIFRALGKDPPGSPGRDGKSERE